MGLVDGGGGGRPLLRGFLTGPALAHRECIGTPTLTETAIVLAARRRGRGGDELAGLLEELDVAVVPFTLAHHEVAARAYERYGRGRHKANLNFGDCLSYAVASLAGDSLLFVGDDFRRTDIEPAL